MSALSIVLLSWTWITLAAIWFFMWKQHRAHKRAKKAWAETEELLVDAIFDAFLQGACDISRTHYGLEVGEQRHPRVYTHSFLSTWEWIGPLLVKYGKLRELENGTFEVVEPCWQSSSDSDTGKS